jgi:hypothetical protein
MRGEARRQKSTHQHEKREVGSKLHHTKKENRKRTGNENSARQSTLLLTLLIEELYARIRRFQLRSLHTTQAFHCTPVSKDAKKYALQDCLDNWMALFRHCC